MSTIVLLAQYFRLCIFGALHYYTVKHYYTVTSLYLILYKIGCMMSRVRDVGNCNVGNSAMTCQGIEKKITVLESSYPVRK